MNEFEFDSSTYAPVANTFAETQGVKSSADKFDCGTDPKERERHNSIIMAEYNRLTSEHNFFEAGVEEGIEKGIEKGKEEERKEIAKKLLKIRIPIEQIIETTGLTKQEIEELN